MINVPNIQVIHSIHAQFNTHKNEESSLPYLYRQQLSLRSKHNVLFLGEKLKGIYISQIDDIK